MEWGWGGDGVGMVPQRGNTPKLGYIGSTRACQAISKKALETQEQSREQSGETQDRVRRLQVLRSPWDAKG